MPPKIRVFWWQVSHDFILCRANLQRRHIEPVGTYIFCGMEDESTYHALAQCSFTISFQERLKRLTRIKLPKLWPWSWTRDLLEDSFFVEWRMREEYFYAGCGHYGIAKMNGRMGRRRLIQGRQLNGHWRHASSLLWPHSGNGE